MVFQPLREAVVVVAVALGVAGCQPAVSTPTPVPSYRCTPEAGGAEFDCSPYQYDEMVAKDKLHAEAEAVYRKFFAEDVRIYRAGGISEPTAVLLETTTGDFLKDSMDLYRSLVKDRRALRGGEVRIVELTRKPGIAKGGSLVVLAACTDARSADVLEAGKVVGRGHLIEDWIYFGRFDGELKIQGADGQEEGKCGNA